MPSYEAKKIHQIADLQVPGGLINNLELSMYQIHPIAQIFPRMPGEEFVALKKDIQANGLLEPIWLYENQVLDGRHRYFACQETGTDATYREYVGNDPVGFTISLNLKRRHLDGSQRAMIAASLANLEHGQRADHAARDANLHVSPVTRDQAAEMLQVSPRSVATAAKIEREAPQEVTQAVKAGAMSLNLAAQVAELPEEEQAFIAAAPQEEIKEVAREVIHNHRAIGTGENEWYTPSEYIEAARELLGTIDVDPASSEIANATVKASSYFSVDDDGLVKDWAGKVWLNPPYAQPAIHHFMQKAVDEFEAGRMEEGVALTHNYTDTKWFHLAAKCASAICFTRGRIGFLSPEGKKAAPTQGQAFFYFGENQEAFADSFCRFGFVMVKP